ncbi:MAG: terminase small subunit [Sandaracinaceae bacterium]|nr:terminase small subunit [Sandaracinaceae bacterium]
MSWDCALSSAGPTPASPRRAPPKRRAFVLAYIGEAQGNATEAARRAGYAVPDPEGARLLGDARVRAAIEAMRAPVERAAIASIDELRTLWTSIARGEVRDTVVREGLAVDVPASLAVRLRASELLGKSPGAFLERTEVKTELLSLDVVIERLPWLAHNEIRRRRQEEAEEGDGDT